MEYLYLALIAVAAYCWVQTFRHIKYLLSLHGGKYLIGIGIAALGGGLTAGKPFIEGAVELLTLSFTIWVCIVVAKVGFAIWRDPNFQRGMKNYNNLGALNENWAPKPGVQLFGGAKPPPSPKAKEKKVVKDRENSVSSKPQKAQTEKPQKPKSEEPVKKNTPYSRNHKTCATCAFWTGEREVDASRVVVRTSAPNLKGKCAGGGHNHAQVPASGTCSSYNKWSALK